MTHQPKQALCCGTRDGGNTSQPVAVVGAGAISAIGKTSQLPAPAPRVLYPPSEKPANCLHPPPGCYIRHRKNQLTTCTR
ncbi:MAG: hypothetical protein P5683_14315, partial [Limnospira sp. PMC 1279.21]|uniref:hypothetical protein n=1 Tax=Limnospira TaxID=2596745 RepID=UPI0028E182C5